MRPSTSASLLAALSLVSTAAPPSPARAQPASAPSPQGDRVLDAATRAELLDTICERLGKAYVFPQVAEMMEADLRARAQRGEYDSVTSARAFAQTMTEHLQGVSRDKHLRVRFSLEPIPRDAGDEVSTARERDDARREFAWMNHGFEKVERLRGNIGYLEFRGFFDPELGEETVAAAMNFIADTDALIVDLRNNGGGDPRMVALICSYFFDEEPVHLNDLYWRDEDRTEEFWTHEKVAGRRYLGKDVYVLTSNRTFSGAEEFAYNLKNLKRATIVGETTGGGAHPGADLRLNDHFSMFVPTGRAINPITKTNWEGTGVAPDVEIPSHRALEKARLMALEKSLPTLEHAPFRAGVESEIAALRAALEDVNVTP